MRILFTFLAMAILGTAAFLARSDYWIVPEINHWQARMLGANKYFPALTVFILALPPLLMLAIAKLWLQKRKSPVNH